MHLVFIDMMNRPIRQYVPETFRDAWKWTFGGTWKNLLLEVGDSYSCLLLDDSVTSTIHKDHNVLLQPEEHFPNNWQEGVQSKTDVSVLTLFGSLNWDSRIRLYRMEDQKSGIQYFVLPIRSRADKKDYVLYLPVHNTNAKSIKEDLFDHLN